VKAELKKAVDELQAALLERELGVNESNQVILDLRVTTLLVFFNIIVSTENSDFANGKINFGTI
jgi:hypothetical protein